MGAAPNIVWIVTTQWRASALSGKDTNASTPAIRGVASNGVDYVQAVTPYPIGPLARAALLTGKNSRDSRVSDYWDPLPPDIPTIADAIAAVGYRTAHFGKWHLSNRDQSLPFVGDGHAKQIVPVEGRGRFMFWEGFESGFLLNDPILHGTRLPEPTRFHGYQSDILLERAATWINESKQPSFCVVSLEAPHPPYDSPTPDFSPVPMDRIVLGANVPNDETIKEKARRELAGYFAHIEATDRSIGRFTEKVNLESTMIVFTSVHGDMHGAHGLFRKGWPYEESVRVPFVVSGPLSGTRRVDDTLVSLTDLTQMALTWAQGEVWRCDRDFAEISMPSVPNIPHQGDRIWYGLRNAKQKIILNADGSPWLCFDLGEDPFEMNNLVGKPHANETVQRLTICAQQAFQSRRGKTGPAAGLD